MLNLSTEAQYLLRLLVSLICGALIGLERERGHRPAGLRTHSLVCVGACLVMITSFWVMERYGLEGDPLRMSAQVISGIGFLGAGTIIKAGRDVRGLTTAACLWIVACIGLGVGAGYYVGGVATTLMVLATLYIFKLVEARIEYSTLEVHVRADNQPTAVGSITDSISSWGASILQLSANQAGDQVHLTLTVHLPTSLKRAAFIGMLMALPDIKSVSDQPM